jgi:hypothetical protein
VLFEDATGTCPHCFETISVPVDPGGGEDQEVYIDCEVCCRPILVRARWNEDLEEYELQLDRG